MDLNATDAMLLNTTKASSLMKGNGPQSEFIYKIYLTRGILAIPMALITAFSNGLVIFLFLKDPRKCLRSSPTCVLVACLALVDFLVGSALEPTDAYYNLSMAFGKKPSVERKDLQSAAAYLLLCSMLLFMLITFDRHTAVSRPILYAHRITKKRIYLSVVSVWIYCALLIFAVRQWGKDFRNEIFCVHVDVVLIITTVLFCKIVYKLRRHTSTLRRFSIHSGMGSGDVYVVQASVRERKVTMTLSLMLVVFVVCTMPWFLMMQIFGYCKICQKNWWVMKLLFILFQANCAFNPFLCTLRMPPYRMALKCILSRYAFSRRFFTSVWPTRGTYHVQRRQRTDSYVQRERMKKEGSFSSSLPRSPSVLQFALKNTI
ncbi:hypothetical protein ACROYT_G017686 [Oculina patagonica]